MANLEEKMAELKEQYSKTKYNKATNKYLGILRKKIANIKKEIASQRGPAGTGYAVKKSGDATIALVGFPNTGKSSLLGALTDADSLIADYAFTTLNVVPGMLHYNGAQIQILDVPGLIEGASIGKGGGKKIVSVIRVSDLIVFIVDVNSPVQLYKLLDELYSFDIRVNTRRPAIRVEKRKAGGIEVEGNGHKIPDKQSIVALLGETHTYNANVVFYQDATLEDFYEVLDESITYLDAIVLLNKIDTAEEKYIKAVKAELERTTKMVVVPMSASKEMNLEAVRASIFKKLNLIRIYLKPKGGNADFEKPLIMKSKSTVIDVARKLHSKTLSRLRHAYITGKSAKFDNQRVGKEHMLQDEDIITLIYDK